MFRNSFHFFLLGGGGWGCLAYAPCGQSVLGGIQCPEQ